MLMITVRAIKMNKTVFMVFLSDRFHCLLSSRHRLRFPRNREELYHKQGDRASVFIGSVATQRLVRSQTNTPGI